MRLRLLRQPVSERLPRMALTYIGRYFEPIKSQSEPAMLGGVKRNPAIISWG